MLGNPFEFMAYSVAGTFLGMVTGMVPGFHTNNLAMLIISISYFFDKTGMAILISSAAISHTFLDIIPSTFLGMPEEDTALVILPAHSMLLKGKAYKAISMSADASFIVVLISLLLLLPFKFIIGNPLNLYASIEKIMFFILLCISAIVVATSYDVKNAAFIFLLSGIFGIAISKFPGSIFPALAGLFGASTIIMAQRKEVPEQTIEDEKYNLNPKDLISGGVAGALVAMLPGVSSGIATTLALSVRKEKRDENAISILSSANTSTNFFVIATLFILMKARSGFAIVIKHMIGISQWINYPSSLFLLLLCSALLSATISLYLTKFMGKLIAGKIRNINYSSLLIISMAIIVSMVILFSGVIGLLIFMVATLIGIISIKMGVRRSNLMGVLLLPLMLFYFPIKF